MPGNSVGNSRQANIYSQNNKPMRDNQQRPSSVSKESDMCLEVLGDLTPDLNPPKRSKAAKVRKYYQSNANGRQSETLDFLPGSAESPPSSGSCGPCNTFSWERCKELLCIVVTCGHYKTEHDICIPCTSSSETSTDDKIQDSKANGIAGNNQRTTLRTDNKPSKNPSFNYPDLKLYGKPLNLESVGSHKPSTSCTNSLKSLSRSESMEKPSGPLSKISDYSFEDLDQGIEELNNSGTDINSLINKKLLELFTLHQIDQLAKCTSDSAFFKKTSEIAELINHIMHNYNLDEQDAECRLVHGVIRISTRKPKKIKSPENRSDYDSRYVSSIRNNDDKRESGKRHNGSYPPDSGNETMIDTSGISQDSKGLDIQISEETSSDKRARDLVCQSLLASPSGSSAENYSPLPETETDSSGAPLLSPLART
ncbi:keratinocyte differentiation factor 1-like [Erpetoichthys calabaricus]|uniref:Keratinocyte differentiation factor 1a n=1 Tax=Erpetoichthys calabaricus TaxID=27687 RepID=A0A8C4T4A4_ERPCA|nr:keratinocyte differentiation factor 1-like [Erpetoichthys calabaricus]XP_028674808.1 keratinocyte differentiation factor 1-like [Erpetoichthys calabaricus]XP_028674809.1 keratinocyte differentiation factor 1-like [Erpetoichthys calabaricus]XP_028674811.1 keratinocyte differentiation factor 1-like [Erpetoichthys calabaricus]XP_051775054.1 keratinocyte differentiation factor 1-like [Erpetoichthys calabaricus]